jgi:hypothetical protein
MPTCRSRALAKASDTRRDWVIECAIFWNRERSSNRRVRRRPGCCIGGLIARTTQGRGLRAELHRYWAASLHDAASGLVASYTLARSTLAQAREAGSAAAPADNELAHELRRNAQARLSLCPMADAYSRRLITFDGHLTRFAPPT